MQKLYHGTVETIAKTAPLGGIRPYMAPHHEDEMVFSDPEANTITLTTVYGAYQAFMAADPKKDERWAIVEVHPDPKALRPCSDLLRGKCKGKLTCQKSLEMVGLCVHNGPILAKTIGKVWIFNPASNWMITRSVLHTTTNAESFAADRKKLEVINRWLTGEFVLIDEWLAEQKEQFTKEQKDQMGNVWNERTGLDLFYHGSRDTGREL